MHDSRAEFAPLNLVNDAKFVVLVNDLQRALQQAPASADNSFAKGSVVFFNIHSCKKFLLVLSEDNILSYNEY